MWFSKTVDQHSGHVRTTTTTTGNNVHTVAFCPSTSASAVLRSAAVSIDSKPTDDVRWSSPGSVDSHQVLASAASIT